jgi:hypothetical protein
VNVEQGMSVQAASQKDNPTTPTAFLPANRHASMLEQLQLYRSLFIVPPREVLTLMRSYIPLGKGGKAHAVFILDIKDKLLNCQTHYNEIVQMSAYSPESCRDFLFPLDHFPRLSAALGIYGTALEKLVNESEKWPSPDLRNSPPWAMRVRTPALSVRLVEECEVAVNGFELVLNECKHTINSCCLGEKKPAQPKNGPEPPNKFRWGNAVTEKLTPDQFGLLSLLWDASSNQPSSSVSVESILERVCQKAGNQMEALRKLRTRTQEKLTDARINISLVWKNKSLSLEIMQIAK